MNSNGNFYQSGEFYTNNPDDELIDNNNNNDMNNNIIEENNNNKKNKLFFGDNDDNEMKKPNDNPFLSMNDEIIENNNNNNINIIENNNNIEGIKDNKREENNNINNNAIHKDIEEIKDNKEEKENNNNINNKEKEEIEYSEETAGKYNNEKIIEENKENKIGIENNNKENIIKENKENIIEENNENIIEEKKEIKKKKKKKKKEIKESIVEDEGLQSLLKISENDEDNIIQKTSIKSRILAILFGQLISLLAVGNGFFVEEIQNTKDLAIPMLLNSSYYLILFLIYFFISKRKIKKPKLIYIILSILDTQANYINVFLFSFIQFEYPYIINILSSIWTVVFSLILLRQYKYLINHILGIIICLIGVFSVFFGASKTFDDFIEMFKSFNSQIKGLLLCILVSILYGLNTVLLEKYISEENDEIKSYCTWLGIFGFFISFIESFIPINDAGFEIKILFITKSNNVDYIVIIFWILSALFLAAMTSLSPFYIQKFGATMYNISLLFTVFWSYMIDSIFIKQKFEFNWINCFYFIGFVIVIAGTIIFMRVERIKKNEFSYS